MRLVTGLALADEGWLYLTTVLDLADRKVEYSGLKQAS